MLTENCCRVIEMLCAGNESCVSAADAHLPPVGCIWISEFYFFFPFQIWQMIIFSYKIRLESLLYFSQICVFVTFQKNLKVNFWNGRLSCYVSLVAWTKHRQAPPLQLLICCQIFSGSAYFSRSIQFAVIYYLTSFFTLKYKTMQVNRDFRFTGTLMWT